jgi:guanylate kinase
MIGAASIPACLSVVSTRTFFVLRTQRKQGCLRLQSEAMKGNLIIISSPSGGGKGTIIKEVLESLPDVGYSVSLTTRAPRFGEEDGKHYYFVSKLKFEEKINADGFLEYAEVHGNWYGTSRKQTENLTNAGKDVILEIDVQGAIQVMEKMPDAVTIFIMPPSYEVLKARLTSRATENPDDLNLRLRNSHAEVKHYGRFKYVVVNDELRMACRKVSSIICAERQTLVRQNEAVRSILDSFEVSKP